MFSRGGRRVRLVRQVFLQCVAELLQQWNGKGPKRKLPERLGVTMALQIAATGESILTELALIGASAYEIGSCGDFGARAGRFRSLSARVALYARTRPEMAGEAWRYLTLVWRSAPKPRWPFSDDPPGRTKDSACGDVSLGQRCPSRRYVHRTRQFPARPRAT